MPEGVIDVLETIKVNEYQRYRSMATFCITYRLADAILKKHTIG